jgi:aromatic ring-opening dioxygenase catalytic subunit (LigB family)
MLHVMTDAGDKSLTRRQALVAGVASVAGAAAIANGLSGDEPAARQEQAMSKPNPSRLPVAFLPHGGGPWPFVRTPFGRPDELAELTRYLESVRALPKGQVKALLVVSAHWEERVPTLMTHAQPPMFYDYYGFPPESYEITWSAPGAPAVAARVQQLLASAGIDSATDAQRGFDHGVFVPLKLAYPQAEIPTLQLSLKIGLDPAEHIAIGRALQPLRDEGVFIVGSGMTYHNLRGFSPQFGPVSEAFDAWLRETSTAAPSDRDARLAQWSSAPSARAAHPREEHLLPLMVIAGAAGEDRGVTAYNGTLLGLRLSAYHFG